MLAFADWSWKQYLINTLFILWFHANMYPFTNIPDSKVHGANMAPTRVLSATYGPHVGPTDLAVWDAWAYCCVLGSKHIIICHTDFWLTVMAKEHISFHGWKTLVTRLLGPGIEKNQLLKAMIKLYLLQIKLTIYSWLDQNQQWWQTTLLEMKHFTWQMRINCTVKVCTQTKELLVI